MMEYGLSRGAAQVAMPPATSARSAPTVYEPEALARSVAIRRSVVPGSGLSPIPAVQQGRGRPASAHRQP